MLNTHLHLNSTVRPYKVLQGYSTPESIVTVEIYSGNFHWSIVSQPSIKECMMTHVM